jgi:hypothetical protein
VFNVTELRKSKRFAYGFLAGIGSALVIWGISFWVLISRIIDDTASWLEEQGYTMAPSGVSALNQIPFISMAIMVIGFVLILIGVVFAMRANA